MPGCKQCGKPTFGSVCAVCKGEQYAGRRAGEDQDMPALSNAAYKCHCGFVMRDGADGVVKLTLPKYPCATHASLCVARITTGGWAVDKGTWKP